MTESDEFDVSLLDDLKPLESFLETENDSDGEREQGKETEWDESILELLANEDFIVDSDWWVEQRIREVSPQGEVTAMTSSGKRTGVGFRDGSCLIFDQNDVLEVRIENENCGAVTSLARVQNPTFASIKLTNHWFVDSNDAN